MLIGAMNHPRHDVLEEIEWMARMELGFVDLTLEPPAALPENVDPAAVRQALDQHAMDVVGHTAYYMPIASPYEPIRRGAVDELRRCLDLFARVGARWMNVHPDVHVPMHDRPFIVERNLQSLRELAQHAQGLEVGLMVENMPGAFNTVDELAELLEPLPELGLHLDIGHCNLRVAQNTADPLIRAFGERLEHVHLHDNKGGNDDLHLPLGTGSVDYRQSVRTLKEVGYDATITLEVFSPDRRQFAFSRDVLREAWDGA